MGECGRGSACEGKRESEKVKERREREEEKRSFYRHQHVHMYIFVQYASIGVVKRVLLRPAWSKWRLFSRWRFPPPKKIGSPSMKVNGFRSP